MKRELEPELMDGMEQARAYAEADFSEPHNMFIAALADRIPASVCGRTVLDLGCGPADITIRYARRFPSSELHAVDGAKAMLQQAEIAIENARLGSRVTLFEQVLPDLKLPLQSYDVIISNSLLHHVHEPDNLWNSIISLSHDGTHIFIMDLMRPESIHAAETLVALYAGDAPEILQRDFYHSLLAAFTPREVNAQLHRNSLGYLTIEILSDRHLCISGQYFSH